MFTNNLFFPPAAWKSQLSVAHPSRPSREIDAAVRGSPKPAIRGKSATVLGLPKPAVRRRLTPATTNSSPECPPVPAPQQCPPVPAPRKRFSVPATPEHAPVPAPRKRFAVSTFPDRPKESALTEPLLGSTHQSPRFQSAHKSPRFQSAPKCLYFQSAPKCPIELLLQGSRFFIIRHIHNHTEYKCK